MENKLASTQVCERLGIKRATLYYLIRSGKLNPKPVLEGDGCYWWSEDDIKRAQLIRARK